MALRVSFYELYYHVATGLCMCVSTRVCDVYAYKCVTVCVYLYVRVHLCVYVHPYIYMCMYIYDVYVNICMYI